MTTKRDIELLISARDTTGRTFKQVSAGIAELAGQIDKQVDAAKRGETSLQSLKQTQDQLAQAGRDLAAVQGQIDAYKRLVDQLAKTGKAATDAETNLAAFKAGLEGVENVTAAQEKKLAGLEQKVVTTGAAYRKVQADVGAAAESLQKAGVATDNLDAEQAKIVASAKAAGASYVTLKGSIDSYYDNIRLARQGEADLAQQQTFSRKLADAQRLNDATQFVRLYTQAVDSAALSDQKVAALNGFREVGQMAAEASRDVSRFVQEGQAMSVTSSEIAAGLRAIIDPAGEALRGIDGIEAAIQQAGATISAEKQSVGAYSQALNQLSEASAALVRTGALIDTFNEQEVATNRARQSFAQAQAEVQRLGRAMQQADVPTDELARSLAVAESKLAAAGRELNAEETRLGQLSKQLRQAGVDTNDLAAAQDRLAKAAKSAGSSAQAGNKILGRNGQKAGGFLGLNPYELQNLSFQINDVFTSLASGQKPLTVLFQQGGQIAQLFPGIVTQLGLMAARFAPLIGIIATFAIGIHNVSAEITALQQAQAQLNLRGIGEGFDPQKIVDAGNALQEAGAKAEDADKAITKVLNTTSNPETFKAIIDGAAEMAEKLGIAVPEAVDLLNGVMTGGIEKTEELATQTHLLTGEELDHAQSLFDAGKAAEARQYILDAVTKKLHEQASLTDGVFTPAVNNLKTAFGNLVGYFKTIAGPVLDWFTQYVKNAIVGFTFLTGLVAGKSFKDAGQEAVNAVLPKAPPGGPAPASAQDVRDRQYKRQLQEESALSKGLTSQERLRRAEVEARRKAQAAGVSKGVEDLAVQQAITLEQRKINEEGAKGARKAGAAARRAQRAAETLQNKRESALSQLQNQLNQLDAESARGGSATLEQRLAVVDAKYQKIFDTISKLRSLGISKTADGTSLDDVAARARAGMELVKQQERIKFYEDQINLLTKQRKDEVAVISDAQERGAKSTTEAYKEAEAVNARISPQIIAAAQQALAIAQAIAGADPSPEMVSMIADLKRIIGGEGTNGIAASVAKSGFSEAEKKLNDLLADRNNLVDAYNTLRELGLKTDAETAQMSVQAYAQTAPAIQEQINKVRENLELMHNTRDALTGLPLVTDAAYAAWIAKLDAVQAGLVKVDDRVAQVNQAAKKGLQDGFVTAFKTVADSIAGVILGTQNFGDVLDSVLTAGLQLLGSFVSAIAEVLVQMAAVQFVKSVLGAGSGGGIGGLLFHSGGVVGVGGQNVRRSGANDNALSWAAAPRFHNGTGMALAPKEYKAVLKQGEEVLTENDPRHIRNIGKGGGGSSSPRIKQTLVFDQNEIPRAMQTRAGEKALLTFVQRNKPTLKQMLR